MAAGKSRCIEFCGSVLFFIASVPLFAASGPSPALCDSQWDAVRQELGPSVADRGWIGMVLRPVQIEPGNKDSPKVLVVDMVLANSPAQGKLQPGDYITKINQVEVTNRISEAEESLRTVRADEEVKFLALRRDTRVDVVIKASRATDPKVLDAWVLAEAGRQCGDATRERLVSEVISRKHRKE